MNEQQKARIAELGQMAERALEHADAYDPAYRLDAMRASREAFRIAKLDPR